MAIVTVDNTSYNLPADEFTAQKVTSYNSLLNAMQAAWVSWTPTWTNLSVGNGTAIAKYRQIGKLVVARLSLVFGNSTSVSGDIIFTLPVTRAAFAGSAGLMPIGQGGALDASVPAAFSAVICTPSTTTANFRFMNSSATYVTRDGATASVPFTWTTSDELAAQIVYEAA